MRKLTTYKPFQNVRPKPKMTYSIWKGTFSCNRIQLLALIFDTSVFLRFGVGLKTVYTDFLTPVHFAQKSSSFVTWLPSNFHKTFMQAGPLQIQAALHKNCWIIAIQWFKVKPKSLFLQGQPDKSMSWHVIPTRCSNFLCNRIWLRWSVFFETLQL